MPETRRFVAPAFALLLALGGVALVAAPAHAAVAPISYTIDAADPVSARVGGSASPCLPAVGSGFHYKTVPVKVDVTGAYSGVDQFSGGDGFLAIYSQPFDPALPDANCVGAIDDDSSPVPAPLTAGTVYYLFQSTFSSGATGSYSFEIAGPGTFAVVVPTTTTVTASPSPATAPAATVLTATVAGIANPTGDVEFFDGATSLGTATLSGAVASLSVTLAKGSHDITAVYAGDNATLGSTSAVYTQVVEAAAAVVPAATLPDTGADSTPLALVTTGVLLLGVMLTAGSAVARRRVTRTL